MAEERATEVGTGADRRQLTDPGAIKALSHPIRLSIVEHLGSTGESATATASFDNTSKQVKLPAQASKVYGRINR
jgi:hypothetical protein